jgi:3,4-dihydroxybenzoyl-citryl-spermidine/N-citryl-spermidine--spermidine ligase
LPESRVLTRLVEALLFERLARWPYHSHPPHGPEATISFRLGNASYRCRGRVGAFGRVRLTAGSVRKLVRRAERDATWRDVLHDLPCQQDIKDAIAEELGNTERLCVYNEEHVPRLRHNRRNLGYDALEGALHEGHPYHPCFKARTGFSLQDHVDYGPETGGEFPLEWLAIRRSALRQALPLPASEFLFRELGACGFAALERARQATATAEGEYGLLPVHPWQWRKLSRSGAVQSALAQRELVPLGSRLGRYRATQSLRTLLPVDRPLDAHVKLSLGVRVSSSLRTLQPETVLAAPALSRWLSQLIASDPFFAEAMAVTVLREYAGVAHTPPAHHAELEGQLAALWREPIARHLAPGEAALPFNALFAVEPDGEPHVGPWLERYGLCRWLDQLLRVTLLPLWRLLAHHGVALEAHAQNLILIHREGMPCRLALRDFHDSVELVPSMLEDPQGFPDLGTIHERFRGAAPGRYYAMSSLIELRDLFIDAALIYNLCELSWLLEQHYGFGEPKFWRAVRLVLDEYAHSKWSRPWRDALLRHRAPFVHTESLFKARVMPGSTTLFHHVVPSSLYESTERDTHADHQ